MDKDKKGFFRRKWFLRLTSLVLALFLFMYVNGSKSGFLRQNTRNNNQSSALMSNKSATIKMPLDVTVDNSKYIVSGYPQYVKVKVNGPSALVTTTMNTQNFKVYADLSDLGPGKHKVKLKTSGLNSELKSTISPSTITVNVQPRKTITMRVSIRLSNKSLDDGYQLGHPRSDIQNVQVTGSREQVNRVDRIVAFVAVPRDTKNTISRQVTLQAVDKNGQTLNVVISPATTNIEIPVVSGDNNSSSTDSDSSSDAKESNSNRATRSSTASSTQPSQASSSSSTADENDSSTSNANE
jgi:YbbR domain-containing protein